jgi:hypothetical protein
MMPYFFSLLAWVGMALGATFLWPITVLVRRLFGGGAVAAAKPEQPARQV